MNDFTKEELNHIANSICLMMSKCSMERKHYDDFEKIGHKIQSMIDNYDLLNCAYVAKVSHPIDISIWNQTSTIIPVIDNE